MFIIITCVIIRCCQQLRRDRDSLVVLGYTNGIVDDINGKDKFIKK